MSRKRSARWLELSIQAPGEFVEPLSSIFLQYSKGGVVVEEAGGHNPDEDEEPRDDLPVTIKTYLPLDETAEFSKARIEVGVRLVALLTELPPLQERVLKESEWEAAWKKGFHVFRVTERLVIRPSWRRYTPAEGEVVVVLDPGMAFGTGYHPTTRMCLRAVDQLVRPGSRVLDVGTGTGILAIAAVKLGAGSVMALDVDTQAPDIARENAEANGAGEAIRVVLGTLPHDEVRPGSYDLVLANISAAATVRLAGELASAVAPGGHVVASGIVQDRAEEAEAALERAGLALRRRVDEGLWVTLVATK